MTDSKATGPRTGCGRSGFGPGACGPQGRFGGLPPFGMRRVPANIEETDDAFVLSLHAAGLQRDQLDISIRDDVLTVSYRGEATPGDSPTGRFIWREVHNRDFERRFALKRKVLIDGITARYVDGVLTLTLPKNPQMNQPGQQINLQ